jgi:hypothetical protein
MATNDATTARLLEGPSITRTGRQARAVAEVQGMIDAVRGMALAARALSRDGLVDLIELDRLTARGVLVRLQASVHPELAAHAAIV